MTSPSPKPNELVPVYSVVSGELMLDAPPDRAWPQVIDYPSWQEFSTVRHISGPVGQEDEVVLLKKEEPGVTEFPPYMARTLKLDPPHKVIWKTYPADPAAAGSFFGIVEFELEAVGDRTCWRYQLIYEFVIPYQSDSQLEAFRQQQYENARLMLSVVLPKLQKLVKERG